MEWLLLLTVVLLWIGVGCALLVFYGRAPRQGSRPLTRSTDRRLCLVGDSIQVTLACSATGTPQVGEVREPDSWDIVLIIDHSSSMGSGPGSALAEAKQAAINLARATPRSFRFAVVAFDHEVRELCPFTPCGRGLMRALKSISGGGATDIALGLRAGGQCLRAAAERKRAVILLSDGGSDHEPAIAAAAALKASDPALLLLTVGVGAADMDLLRRLASSPDQCYRADQLEALKDLYRQIGRMLAGRRLGNVEVTERFDAAGGWALRAWGELQPAQRRAQDGRFSWLLATLEETPTELTYTVEALCPGWRDVAPEPALLELDAGAPIASNRGPRLLVLPRMVGWQLLWLLLNPLFFLLFGRWFCRRQGVSRRLPAALQPKPLNLPKPLQPSPVGGVLSPRPSLVVSLGYGGAQALTHGKRLLWERDRRVVMDNIRWLAVDMAGEEFFPNPTVGLVSLSPEERLHLNRPLEPLLAAAAAARLPTRNWLPARQLLAGAARPDLQRGAGHQRALGRLAVSGNRAALEQRLRPLLQALFRQADANGIDILVIGAAGGGAASGGMLELCWLLRRLAEEQQGGAAALLLFLLAPAAREEPMAMDKREKQSRSLNCRALLLELDRLAALRHTPLAPAPEDAAARRWFDRVFAIGPAALTEPALWSARHSLYPKGGEALFCWLTAPEFRRYFQQQDPDVTAADASQNRDRCLVHRLDPNAYFLYPRTLGRYLAVESWRRELASRLWALAERSASAYAWRGGAPAATARVKERWLQAAQWEGDFPWVFRNMNILAEAGRLQQALSQGAGPTISADISSLQWGEHLDEQRRLTRALLDAWVTDTLNGKLEGACGPHALSTVIYGLKAIQDSLIKGASQARRLAQQSDEALARDEAGLVVELCAQAAAEVGACRAHLLRCDAVLGEGTDAAVGLLRYLDRMAGELQEELNRLMGVERQDGWPRLPLTWDQVDALRSQTCDPAFGELLERIRWRLRRDGVQPALELYFSGAAPRVWTVSEQLGNQDDVAQLMEDLIQAAIQLTPTEQWRLADWADKGTLDRQSRLEPPRSDGLNPGAKAVYLVQEGALFKVPPHVPTVSLAAVDAQESRVIGCEQNLSTESLWPYETEEPLPFVFTEEHNAYGAYDAYCRERGLKTGLLHPAIVGLCREPDALLAFALAGLAGGAIESELQRGQRWWIANQDSGRYELAEARGEPLQDFLNVANAWITRAEPAFRKPVNPAEYFLADLAQRINAHPLLEAVGAEPARDQFNAIVGGLLLLRGAGR